MADAAIVLDSINVSRRRIERTYTVTMPNSSVTSADIDLTTATNPNNLGNAKWGRPPDGFRVDNPPAAATKFAVVPGVALDDWAVACDNGNYSSDANIRITLSGPIGV